MSDGDASCQAAESDWWSRSGAGVVAMLLNRLGSLAAEMLFLERCRLCRGDVRLLQCTQTGCSSKTLCFRCWQGILKERPLIDWCATGCPGLDLPVASGTSYQGGMKKLIYHLKYDHDRLIADDLAHLLVLSWTLVSHQLNGCPIVMVPVPLHQSRMTSRGYNQAELLARSAARQIAVKVDAAALTRVKPTAAQYGLGRCQRFANLQGAFSCDSKRVNGAAVVLVDDVYTSGATLCEAARTLVSGGASCVVALTVARSSLVRPARLELPAGQSLEEEYRPARKSFMTTLQASTRNIDLKQDRFFSP